MYRMLALAVAAVALLAGCDTAEDYYPMAVGSVWNYSHLSTMETSLDALDTFAMGTSRVEVARNTHLTTGEEVAEFVYQLHMTRPLPVDTTYHNYMREVNGRLVAYSDTAGTRPETLLAIPPEMNKSWSSGLGSTGEYVDQSSVTVAAGTYNKAWKVRMAVGGDTANCSYWWYANGTGNVLFEYHYTASGHTGHIRQELTSADVK